MTMTTAEFQDGMGYRKGKAVIKIVLPLPPTDNNIYVNTTSTKGKGPKRTIRILSDEAKSYKRATASEIAEMAIMNAVQFRQNVPYLVILRVFFDEVETKGWPDNAKNRYKKVDTTNRGKLLIDSVMQAIGVDDHHIFPVIKFKEHDPDDPRVEAEVYEMSHEEMDDLYDAIEEAVTKVLWA